jgi:hypothetical protein
MNLNQIPFPDGFFEWPEEKQVAWLEEHTQSMSTPPQPARPPASPPSNRPTQIQGQPNAQRTRISEPHQQQVQQSHTEATKSLTMLQNTSSYTARLDTLNFMKYVMLLAKFVIAPGCSVCDGILTYWGFNHFIPSQLFSIILPAALNGGILLLGYLMILKKDGETGMERFLRIDRNNDDRITQTERNVFRFTVFSIGFILLTNACTNFAAIWPTIEKSGDIFFSSYIGYVVSAGLALAPMFLNYLILRASDVGLSMISEVLPDAIAEARDNQTRHDHALQVGRELHNLAGTNAQQEAQGRFTQLRQKGKAVAKSIRQG